jgi:hypothetical protein
MPQRGQRTTAPLHITAGQVIQHKPLIAQMAFRERFLDPRLAVNQPIQRSEQLRLGDLSELELLRERGLREAPGHRQLRPRRDQHLADHRDNHIPLPTALPREQPLQIQLAQHPKHRRNMPMPQRARDVEVLIKIDQHLPREHLADRIDDRQRQV